MTGKWGIKPLGWTLIKYNLGVYALLLAEYLAYYHALPNLIKENFATTPLKDSPSLSEPVLIEEKEFKFVFKHRGGSTASQSVMYDTFYNNKRMLRAIALQWLSAYCFSVAVLKEKAKLPLLGLMFLMGNTMYTYPVVSSGLRLLYLSMEVKDGNAYVWENLNEFRYMQRMEEFFSPQFKYSRDVGQSLVAMCLMYSTPIIGFATVTLSVGLQLHKKVN